MMERIDIYKIVFDFDNGEYNPNSEVLDACLHVTASSESRAKATLRTYVNNVYGGDACIIKIRSIEKIPLIDGAVLENSTGA